ncbi:MAG: VTT domain-containing protein [Methylophaga sp.]|nr:VTT domain-containing protein [Methylophaga sp.]
MPRAVKRLLLLVIVMLSLALVWRYLINNGLINAGQIEALLNKVNQWQQLIWLMPMLVIVYVVLLSVMFPLTLLVIATGFLFDPLWALLAAVIGSLTSSAVSFFIGHYVGREAIEKHGGKLIQKAETFMQNNTINSMIVINLLPIAPFTLTNMLAGALKMRFMPYMLGSAIGLIPGLLAVILVGSQLGKIIRATEAAHIWQGLGIAVIAISVLALIIYRVNQRSHFDEL